LQAAHLAPRGSILGPDIIDLSPLQKSLHSFAANRCDPGHRHACDDALAELGDTHREIAERKIHEASKLIN
jgi:hypothetical protein